MARPLSLNEKIEKHPERFSGLTYREPQPGRTWLELVPVGNLKAL